MTGYNSMSVWLRCGYERLNGLRSCAKNLLWGNFPAGHFRNGLFPEYLNFNGKAGLPLFNFPWNQTKT